MGVLFSRLFSSLFGRGDIRILILGLDNAGKTTLLYKLQLNQIIETVPTIGFNVETVTYNNLQLQVWDLGGQGTIRPYWRCYYPNTNAVIYVVDSTDVDRMSIAKQEMITMLQESDLKGIPLLVFANKQDVPGALSEAQVSEMLGLSLIKNRQWRIVKASAKLGEGVAEGLDWLIALLRDG
jgi:ADP-ribosylation factor-like protein 1